jgi:hypothetical protein
MYSTYSTHWSNETIFSPLSWRSHRHWNVLERSRTAEVGVVVFRTRRLRRRQQRKPRGPGRSAGTEQLGSGLGMQTSGPYRPGLQLLWPGLERELPSATSLKRRLQLAGSECDPRARWLVTCYNTRANAAAREIRAYHMDWNKSNFRKENYRAPICESGQRIESLLPLGKEISSCELI